MSLALHEYVTAGHTAADLGGKAGPPRNPKASSDVVTAEIAVGEESEGKRKVVVTLRVAEGWHVYANPVGNDNLLDSQTVVTLFVDGKAAKADVTYPKGKEHRDAAGDRYNVYEGKVVATAAVNATGIAKVEARVKVTACSNGQCLLPSVLRVGK